MFYKTKDYVIISSGCNCAVLVRFFMNVFFDVSVLFLDLFQSILIVIFILGGVFNESKRKLGLFVFLVASIYGISYTLDQPILYSFRNMLLCMIMLKICFDYKILKSILCGFITFAVPSFVSCMIMNILEQCGIEQGRYLETLGGFGSTLILILLIFIFKKTIQRTVNVSQNVWTSLIVGMFLFFLLYVVGYPYFYSVELHTVKYLIYVLCLAILMVCLGVLFILVVNQNNELKISQKVNEEKNKLMHSYYAQLEERDIEIRKFRHDYKNHVRGILYYIAEANYEELKKYAETISEETESYNIVFDVGHNYINAILNHFYADAKKENISIEVTGSVENAKRVDDYDWSIIIPNMLNNAIEATRNVEDENRVVKVTFKNNREKVIVSVANPVKEAVDLTMLESVKTTKSDRLNHGYGMKNIKKSVEKYHGDMSYEINEKNQFVMVIWI